MQRGNTILAEYVLGCLSGSLAENFLGLLAGMVFVCLLL
jgi:hypothetical protein